MKGKSSLHRYLAIIGGGGWKSLVSVLTFGLFSVSGTFGATYYWKGGSSWADYGTLSNWSTENATDGAAAESLPGAADSLATQKSYFDLGGKTWEIGIYSPGSGHRFYFTNGTFRVTKSSEPKGEQTHIYAGATVTCASGVSFCLGCWDANPLNETVHSGGILDYSPSSGINAHNWNLTIEAGGVARLCQKWWDGLVRTHTIRNSGTLDLSSGFFARQNSAGAKFNFTQNTGTLLLGGPFSNSGYANELTLTLSGGTLALAGEASFSATSVTVAENSSLIIDIPSGVDVDLTPVVFGQGAAITKTGAGDFTYMLGNMPSSLAVNEGGILLDTADTLYDLSDVTFAAGAKVKIGALGITLASCDSSIASATFDVADGLIPSSGATVLTCTDATVLAQARAGLNAVLAPVGITVEIDGNSLVAESHYTFNSSTVSNMNDTAGWVNNLAAPAGQPAIIAGSATEAAMDHAVPAYSAISVTDGAKLTVAATRDIPAITLDAGTAIRVAATSGITYETRNHPDYLTSTAVAVGAMDPSLAVTEIAGIAGIVGGVFWNTGTAGTDYDRVTTTSIDDGATLRAQFKKFDKPYTKCVIVDFTKDAEGVVYARTVAAKFIEANNLDYDFAAGGDAGTVATSDSGGGYGVKGLTFQAPYSAGSPVAVTATGDFATTGSGSVTVDVAADCVLDLSGVDVTTEATLVKTGDGTIVFGGELPAPLDVQAGVLAVQPYVEYDMTGVTLGHGATVKVAIDGELKPCLATPGQNGTTVYMTGDTYVGVGGWDTLANWASGALPDASAVVHIYGSETVLTLDAVPAVMPASISVEGGATLKTATDVSLPALTLDKQASLSIDSGITTLANGLVGVALVDGGNVTIPALAVRKGATLAVPGGINFKNVDITLEGTLQRTSGGTLTFGYADSGETTYIGFHANAAIIPNYTVWSYDAARIGFCCPAAGGTVYAIDTIEFKNMPTSGTHLPQYGDSYWNGLSLGVNNPATAAFDIVFDNTRWTINGKLFIKGGAIFRLKNGSMLANTDHETLWGRAVEVSEAGQVVVGNGSELRINALGDWGNGTATVSAATRGHEAIVVEDGGIYETYRTSGNNNAKVVVSNGVYRIYRPSIYHNNNGNIYNNANVPFNGLAAIELGENSLLSVTTRNGNNFTDNLGPRVVALANVPIVGNGGSVTLSNANVNAFGVVVRSGANTATGSASVTAVDGTGATTLYFANGANWAGTVVAGNVALTNLTDGAAAATATFGSLNLAADFPIRVWKSEGVYSSDAINVGSFINNGGKISPVMMSEGEEFAKGDSFVVGKIAKGATLPAVATGWAVKARSIDGDDAYDEIVLKSGVGLQIILR